MSNLSTTHSNPDCSTCQYHCLGKFSARTVEAEREFDLMGRAYALPAGASLASENVGDDRILVICSGQIKLVSILRDRAILNIGAQAPGDARDLNTSNSEAHTDVAEVTAQTIGPTFVKIVPRADFLQFIRSYGQIGLSAAGTLAEVRVCFLGCASPGFTRLCTWTPHKYCSCFKTVEAA